MYKSGWVAPPSEKNGGKDYITEERLKEVREAGINLMQPCHSSFEDAKRLVEAAAKFDVDVIIPIENTLKEDFDPNKIAFELEYYKNSETRRIFLVWLFL